jgi:hypothetical protein
MLRHPEASQGSLPSRFRSLEGKASKGTKKIFPRRPFSFLSTAGKLSGPLYKKTILSKETEKMMSGSSSSQFTTDSGYEEREMSTAVKPFTGHKERLSGSLEVKASKETKKTMSRQSSSSLSTAGTLSGSLYKKMILPKEATADSSDEEREMSTAVKPFTGHKERLSAEKTSDTSKTEKFTKTRASQK